MQTQNIFFTLSFFCKSKNGALVPLHEEIYKILFYLIV